ncbi:hypothetical protein H6G08_07370 [Calothrix anomala FACHB-343]|uniref:Uncharacterized protein n=1 Tax=Calothrix anomala FACHB-343 TaxID=2692894 RepID=A0ABR8ARG8_9CYAN|nr:hypothetical protein [Calothrix anomala FACHB-343]
MTAASNPKVLLRSRSMGGSSTLSKSVAIVSSHFSSSACCPCSLRRT